MNDSSDPNSLWLSILGATEFWSAIVGAVVGGLIAYAVQTQALREGRKLRDEDHKRVEHALGYSLLFKMMRIYSDFYGIHEHIESCFQKAARDKFEGAPWQFFLPLANPPEPVHFSSEEMGMLLALKHDDVFNSVLSMDFIHNSLIDAIKVLNTERRALTEQLKADEATSTLVGGVLNKQQMLALQPRMIEVNGLIEDIRARAKMDFEESHNVLGGLHKVLTEKLGLGVKLESTLKR